MVRRSVGHVVLLCMFTAGIYTLLWLLSTKEDMNRNGDENLPTAWLLLVPIANIWWLWEWAGAIARYTQGRQPQGTAFWCTFLLHPVGVALTQQAINFTLDSRPEPGELPQARLVRD